MNLTTTERMGNMEQSKSYTIGGGVVSLSLLWGFITQCLNWAGVISWPWYAIWGPAILGAVFTFLTLTIAVVLLLLLSR